MSRPSPLLGFNNNLRYKGQVFHVQTEDSGIRHPHVITHLFMDGGRILKTTKTSYAEHVGQPGYADHVKALMKEQHRAMFRTLKAGDLDALIAQKSGRTLDAASAQIEPPPPSETAAEPPASPAPQAASSDDEDEDLTSSEVRMAEALERAADEASGVRDALRVDDLPPPASVAAPRADLSGYRVVATEPPTRAPSERPASRRPKPHLPSSSKFAVGRPAASFGEQAAFFGTHEVADEQTLDDVILGYLADDLDPPKNR